jgi:mycofactocin precursor
MGGPATLTPSVLESGGDPVIEPTIIEAGGARAPDDVETVPEAVEVDGPEPSEQRLVELATLIEDVSIDGMCGVY